MMCTGAYYISDASTCNIHWRNEHRCVLWQKRHRLMTIATTAAITSAYSIHCHYHNDRYHCHDNILPSFR